MTLLCMLALLAAAGVDATHGAIEATIRGTTEPLEVVLLVRNPSEEWKEVDRERLPGSKRRVRFDGLPSGVYQLLVRGPRATEQFAMKIGVGGKDVRRTTIEIAPFVLTGRVQLGGTNLGTGVLVLRHRELHWRAGITLAPDGTFTGPFWQRGPFTYTVSAPALPTHYADATDIDGPSPAHLEIDIPDGRISGIVRDAKSGAPVAGALVALQSITANREDNVKLSTNTEGRFDFVGIKYGRHVVRIFPPRHLEPEPFAFALDARTPLRELDVRLDPGREVALVVIDRDNDPVAGAQVFAVADSKLRARVTTDEDGRASVPVPAGEAVTLFAVSADGPFGMLRVPRDAGNRRLQLYLPRTSSSLLIRAQQTDGGAMPPFSLLMRFNGELVPADVADELTRIQGLQLMTGPDSAALLRNIPTGSYEFWPYRGEAEAEAIVAGGALFPPIQVNVRTGENKIAVKFAARRSR